MLYQDFDQVATNANPNDLAGNQLVETVSTNGTSFLPVVNANGVTTGCQGLAPNCVTDNEGISGNQVVDPGTGNVYIAHTALNGNSAGSAVGVAVSEGKITPGSPSTATWADSPNLDASLCPDPSCVDSSGNPEELAGENFASIARDSAGYLYVTFTAGPVDHASSSDPNFGELTAPEQIYVVHSLEPATMTDPSKVTWSAPTQITGSGISAGTNTFPWITAGSNGRVDVAYYHANEVSEQGTCGSGSGTCTNYGAARLTKAEWSVQIAQSLDAHAAAPAYHASRVSEVPVKHGPICTNGLGCTTGGDRSLGDFLQVTTDQQGAALVSYVFDTSGNHQGGEDAGPEVISRQISGPGLLAGHDRHPRQRPRAVQQLGHRPHRRRRLLRQRHPHPRQPQPGPDRRITGQRVSQRGPARHVDRHHQRQGPEQPGGRADDRRPGRQLDDPVDRRQTRHGRQRPHLLRGHGQQRGRERHPHLLRRHHRVRAAQQPEEHCKYLTYPQTNAINGAYNASTGVITLTIPTKLIGMQEGSHLYSVTAFTATSTTPQSSTTLFNLIDATTPFDFVDK